MLAIESHASESGEPRSQRRERRRVLRSLFAGTVSGSKGEFLMIIEHSRHARGMSFQLVAIAATAAHRTEQRLGACSARYEDIRHRPYVRDKLEAHPTKGLRTNRPSDRDPGGDDGTRAKRSGLKGAGSEVTRDFDIRANKKIEATPLYFLEPIP